MNQFTYYFNAAETAAAAYHEAAQATVRSAGMVGGYTTARLRPYMGPGPLDAAREWVVEFIRPEGGRPVRPVHFSSARSTWTWISRQVRSNPYIPIRVPAEFREATLKLKKSLQKL